jgi:F0F1-type ATP synthase membrane subunit b/b'
MGPDDYLELKRRAERLGRELERIKGERNRLQKQLREEFGCESTNDARKMLAGFVGDLQEEEELLEKLIEKFNRRWAEVLK